MGFVLRVIQILALSAGVGLFALLAYSDPAGPPPKWVLLIGCGIFGFGAMWASTYFIVLALHGREAAKSLDWY